MRTSITLNWLAKKTTHFLKIFSTNVYLFSNRIKSDKIKGILFQQNCQQFLTCVDVLTNTCTKLHFFEQTKKVEHCNLIAVNSHIFQIH